MPNTLGWVRSADGGIEPECTSPGQCGGLAIVHLDGEFTCSEAECIGAVVQQRPIDTHSIFVSCTDVLGADCPLCSDPIGSRRSWRSIRIPNRNHRAFASQRS